MDKKFALDTEMVPIPDAAERREMLESAPSTLPPVSGHLARRNCGAEWTAWAPVSAEFYAERKDDPMFEFKDVE